MGPAFRGEARKGSGGRPWSPRPVDADVCLPRRYRRAPSALITMVSRTPARDLPGEARGLGTRAEALSRGSPRPSGLDCRQKTSAVHSPLLLSCSLAKSRRSRTSCSQPDEKMPNVSDLSEGADA